MKTRIFGTLGPSCCTREVLLGMLRKGMTGVRLNLSHVGLAQVGDWLSEWRASVEEYCKAVGADPDGFDLLCDMQGPEMRIGKLSDPVSFSVGETITLPVQKRVVPLLERGQRVKLDDGKYRADILAVEGCSIRLKLLDAGVITGAKSIKLEEVENTLDPLTAHDLKNISLATGLGVTGVMQPFVRGREDLVILRRALDAAGAARVRIYAKIENRSGLAKVSEIAREADWIVIARGDLGNDLPLWELPRAQRRIAGVCRAQGVPFIVVTQMLDSMTHSPVPTRAEVSDIDHAIVDGASGVMVTGETAVGEYPVEVIRYLVNTVRVSEESIYESDNP